jgi:hypothetical protein
MYEYITAVCCKLLAQVTVVDALPEYHVFPSNKLPWDFIPRVLLATVPCKWYPMITAVALSVQQDSTWQVFNEAGILHETQY